MQFLRKHFQPSPSPEPVFEDPTLGRMVWSQDDEAWTGTYNGFRFAIAHEGAARPSPRLVSLAADVLGMPFGSRTLSKTKNAECCWNYSRQPDPKFLTLLPKSVG
jgi:hypothetical protein